jgi:hypothetical protein
VFKQEKADDTVHKGLLDTYQQLYQICKLRSVQLLILVLLTNAVCMAPADAVEKFKVHEFESRSAPYRISVDIL